jgi:AcrR family transcriptional regulator
MEDRRIQRTRKLLEEAFLALIEKQSYESITVQQITNRANLGRATFYCHYHDKEQLLLATLQALHDDLEQRLSPLTVQDLATGNTLLSVTIFQHVAAHADLYRVLLSERGAAFARHFLMAYVTRKAEQYGVIGLLAIVQEPAIPISFLAEYASGTLLGAVSWWLNHGQPKTPEEMGQIVRTLIVTNIVSILGIDLTPLP